MNTAPNHTTIARFRQRDETALAEFFGEVLALCADAGLLRIGVVAVDGSKIAANAAPQATRTYAEIARISSPKRTPSTSGRRAVR